MKSIHIKMYKDMIKRIDRHLEKSPAASRSAVIRDAVDYWLKVFGRDQPTHWVRSGTDYPVGRSEGPATKMPTGPDQCLNIRANGTRCLKTCRGAGYCDRCVAEVQVRLARDMRDQAEEDMEARKGREELRRIRVSHDWDSTLNVCRDCDAPGESPKAK